MRRRAFMAVLGGVAGWPLAARAQQPERVRRVGVLMHLAETSTEGQTRVAALRAELEKRGWAEGRNVSVDYRWAGGRPGSAPALAAEMLARTPDVVIAGNSEVARAIQHTMTTIPLVFAEVIDPIGNGLVARLDRPGGNITGFAMFDFTLGQKWLELLKQLAPALTHATAIYDPATPSSSGFITAIETAAPTLALRLFSNAVRNASDVETALSRTAGETNGGVVVLPGSIMAVHRALIIDLAVRLGLPIVFGLRDYVLRGGLASYGVDSVDLYRRAASYVDRILRGEKPGDLPVQVSTKFELVLNMVTAKALGLAIPPSLLARADEVIE